MRKNDDMWLDIVRWTLFVLINGEEYGVNSSNIDQLSDSADPNIRSLLTLDKDTELGLGSGWAYRILKQVGNYQEIYERNIGKGSSLNINRGLNNLWNRGSILYAPPLR